MREIVFPDSAVCHSISHFSVLDERIYSLLADHYNRKELEETFRKPGSKFFGSFATSPQEAVFRLQRLFPDKFDNAKTDPDGKIRLSFCLNEPVGTSGMVSLSGLDDSERQTIREETYHGCQVRTVRVRRTVMTCECQLILIAGKDSDSFCTIFPGELAPPLPYDGKEAAPYWETHLLVRYDD